MFPVIPYVQSLTSISSLGTLLNSFLKSKYMHQYQYGPKAILCILDIQAQMKQCTKGKLDNRYLTDDL